MSKTPDPPDELDAVLAEILRAAEAGAPLDAEAWGRRYPAWADDVRVFCADLERFGPLLRLRPPTTDETMPFPSPTDHAPLDTTSRLGGYEILGELGRGGMGVVYRARPTGTEREVALKVFNPNHVGGSDGLLLLRAEFNSFCRLTHPHVVPVYHYGEDGGRAFYTMELIQGSAAGGSLADEMPRLCVELRRGVELLEKVARAVHHAHQRQILHRDLKPANVLIDAAGEPRVADFGLAVRLDGGRADAGTPRAGSLPWMAPETLTADRELTTAIDVWALGVILYEMMSGRRPFAGSAASVRQQIESAAPPPPRPDGARADADLEAICSRCLRRDPAERYGSAEALADDLARWRAGKIPQARRHVSRAERVIRWCRANPLLAAAPLLAILLLTGVTAATLDALRAQERRTVEEVNRGNRAMAGHAANTIRAQLELMADELMHTAKEPRLHEEFVRRERSPTKDGGPLRALLEEERQRRNLTLRRKLGTSGEGPLTTMILFDVNGAYVAESPRNEKSAEKVWLGRDYFHQAMRRQKATGLAAVHVSRIFRSENDGLFKLALSMPVRAADDPRVVIGVLMTTVATGPTFGLSPGSDAGREVILVGPLDELDPHQPPQTQRRRAPRHLILLHPAYGDRERKPLTLEADRLPELRTRGEDGELDLPPANAEPRTDDDYRDPMAERDAEHEGRWLAAFSQVGNTELVVGVQQRYDRAAAPSRELLRRLTLWAGLGAAVVAVSLVAAWGAKKMSK